MSDDLISRKALYAGVEATRDSWSVSPYVTSDDMRLYQNAFNTILEFISDFPTAFDKEKVIEELENYLFEKYCVEGDGKVAEIVEKGGIE